MQYVMESGFVLDVPEEIQYGTHRCERTTLMRYPANINHTREQHPILSQILSLSYTTVRGSALLSAYIRKPATDVSEVCTDRGRKIKCGNIVVPTKRTYLRVPTKSCLFDNLEKLPAILRGFHYSFGVCFTVYSHE